MHKSPNNGITSNPNNDEIYDFATQVQTEFNKEYEKYLQSVQGTFRPDPNIADIVYTVVYNLLAKNTVSKNTVIRKITDISSI